MKIELSPALEQMVQDLVDTGLYGGPDEVVGEVLRLLDVEDGGEAFKLKRLREMVDAADRSLAEARVSLSRPTRSLPSSSISCEATRT